MISELKIFLGLLIVVLLTLSSMAEADETYYWIHFRPMNEAYSYPIFGMFYLYHNPDERLLTVSTNAV